MKRKSWIVKAWLILICFLVVPGCVQPEDEEDDIKYRPPQIVAPDVPSVIGPWHALAIDTDPAANFKIVQAIPPNMSSGVSPRMGVNFFFDDQIDPATVHDKSIMITAGGVQITGTYTAVLTPAGFTCLSFIPYEPWPHGVLVRVSFNGGSFFPDDRLVKDNDGGILTEYVSFPFVVAKEDLPSMDTNLGFENGLTGIFCGGDCAVFASGTKGVTASEGSNMIGISSGNVGLVSTRASLTLTTSFFNTGAITIPPGMNNLVLDYKMISSEYKEYMNSPFDDSFIISIAGTEDGATLGGMYANITDSVNMTDPLTLFLTTFPGMPDVSADAWETPWLTESIPLAGIRSPIYVSFVASDVGDNVYSTIVIIDNIRFTP